MPGSEGLWCSSNNYGETRTLATLSRTMAIPETRRYRLARLSFDQRETTGEPFATDALV
jgi:hypothetical protein